MTEARVLVTGGAGFVGSAIVAALVERQPRWTVIVLDLHIPNAEATQRSDVEYIRGDITGADAVRQILLDTKPDIVIHTAGLVPPLNERYGRRLEKQVYAVNVEGTRSVVHAAQAAGCRGLVYTSSCCAVTDDLTQRYANIDERWPVSQQSSIYGESKVHAEGIVMAANNSNITTNNRGPALATCILRPSVIFGEGDTQLVPSLHACIRKHETPYIIGDAANLWDTVYVRNVADAHVLAAENLLQLGPGSGSGSGSSAAGEIFFIQNNEPVSFRDFSLQIWKNFGHVPPFELTIPARLGWTLGLLAEGVSWLLGTPITLSRGSVLDACATRYASGEKARRILGYVPRVSLEEGLRRSCQEYAMRLKAKQRGKS